MAFNGRVLLRTNAVYGSDKDLDISEFIAQYPKLFSEDETVIKVKYYWHNLKISSERSLTRFK